ncbi:MAG: primosomal protein N' [Thermoleophilia bacterium]|nr:primosomal protein N' [Thermoleophilia bacterium]
MTANESRIAQVVPLLRLHHLGDRRFDYLVPGELIDRVVRGSLVTVPFGKRRVRAVVVDLGASESSHAVELRPIESLDDDRVPEELLHLARGVSERYLSSYEAALRLVAPPAAARGRRSAGAERKTWVVRTPPEELSAEPPVSRLTPKQKALLEAIPEDGVAIAGLCRSVGVGPGVLRTLGAKGLVELRPGREAGVAPAQLGSLDDEAAGNPGDPPVPILWPEQEEAVRALVQAYEGPQTAERLLWGVTGSGKTEVYLRLIARVLQKGAGVILLVPEIALTPQMIGRVQARFGSRVGVLHSGLSTGERIREYRRIACGEARVVVGARSAVFAPVADVRLIIIDECHDSSYKQEEEPRYHVRTVAQMRLGVGGGLLLEGSATPPVESARHREHCVRLTHRAVGSEPEIEVVDMRRQGGGDLLAPRCRDVLAQTLRAGEQAIVLLNRRGYAGYVHCSLCGHVMTCEDCELSLTYHSQARRLLCHHCGRSYGQPPLCPACGEAPLTRAAPGTERLDKELRALVPNEQVFRMDSDILTSGTRVRALLEAFQAAHPGVLVGTQMVAKGHDFPAVTLVVVADADTGLYVPDFRAAERTFQLLTQVAGRAGRADRPGRVLVQTWNPDVPCIRMALHRDEQAFYSEELATRSRLGYPPFAELIRLTCAAEDGGRAQVGAEYLVERLSPYFHARELLGPVRLPALRGKSRWHLLIAAADGERARGIVGQAMGQLQEPYRARGVVLLVDVDPQSFN